MGPRLHAGHFSTAKSRGAVHLSMQAYISKYCPVQCASCFPWMRFTHAWYARSCFMHSGLHDSSIAGFGQVPSSMLSQQARLPAYQLQSLVLF